LDKKSRLLYSRKQEQVLKKVGNKMASGNTAVPSRCHLYKEQLLPKVPTYQDHIYNAAVLLEEILVVTSYVFCECDIL
jgi:hypothetical protein